MIVVSSPKSYVIATAVAAVVMLLMDSVWLGYVVRSPWRRHVLSVQKSEMQIRMLPAVITYILMVLAAVALGVSRVRSDRWWQDSLFWGSLIGLSVYGVFNGTNLAIFKDYEYGVAAMDTAWGVVLFAIIVLAASGVAKYTVQ